MKKQFVNRMLSLLLSFVMVLGMLPAVTPHVHATDAESSMTLTGPSGTVSPTEIIDTEDTKLKVYNVIGGNTYTLTTSDDNEYGVLFKVSYGVDEDGYNIAYVDIVFDNVTIRTSNPRHNITSEYAAGHYGAVMVCGAGEIAQKQFSLTANLFMKGTNTIELLGAKNPTATETWSAIDFRNCYNCYIVGIGSNAELNVTTSYSDAVGETAAIRSSGSLCIGSDYTPGYWVDESVPTAEETDPLNMNVTAATVGNGLVTENLSFTVLADTDLDITAVGTGILLENKLADYHGYGQIKDSSVNISAGTAGITVQGLYEKYGDPLDNDYAYELAMLKLIDSTVNVEGIAPETAPLSGLNTAADITIENTNLTVKAVNYGLDATYDMGGSLGYNHVTSIQIKDGSNVTVTANTGAVKDEHSREIAALETGSYYSEIKVYDSVLDVTAGYLAAIAYQLNILNDGEFYATTTKTADSALGCYYLTVGAADPNAANSKPGKLVLNSAAERLGVGQAKYVYSDNVWIHTAGGAPISPLMGSHSTTLGDDIVLMESKDGVNWMPISTGKNSLETMRYLTTIPQSSHVCANDDPDQLTFDEATSTHSGPCLVCSQTFTHNCVLEDEIPAYTKHPDATTDGVRYWECLICEGETPETVPAHECEDYSDNNWVQYENQPGNYHVAHCIFTYGEGKICDNSIIRNHVMTGEFHVDADTIRNECTVCDFFREYTGTASAVEFPAKDATCTAPGNVACWSCSHCGNYFADEACSSILTPGEVFTQPAAHSYGEDGVCTVCGYQQKTLSFVPEEGFPNDYEYYYVVLGKTSDGKLYAMGNDTNADGRREAVEIPAEMIAADGTVTLTSEMAEFLYFETVGSSNTAWMADGGCFTFTVQDGFFLYDKAHYGNKCVPYPGYFYPNYSSDEPGSCELYAHDKNYKEKVWVYFNEEDLCFDISTTQMKNIYLYIQLCEHPGLYYNEPADPTCTEQGTREYYGCGKCGTYYSDAAATVPYEFPDYVDPGNLHDVNQYFQLPALWHSFDNDGVCINCGMLRQVYKPVTSLEQFVKLSEDAYYIIVFKDLKELATVPVIGGGEEGDIMPSSEMGDDVLPEDVTLGEDTGDGDMPSPSPETGGEAGSDRYSGKTFAAFLPDVDHRFDPCVRDSDGDGLVDVMEADTNGNGIPDCIEVYIDTYRDADSDEDGTTTVAEYNEMIGDYTDDGVVNMDDYLLFFSDYVYRNLYYEYEDQGYAKPNIVEVTVAADGSITIVDEAAMEFQMMESGVWGGQEYDAESLEYDKEHDGVLETDRLRAAWVPNYWIGNYGDLGYYENHLLTQNRTYGDGSAPGITDNKNWKISFRGDGTACLVSTWTDFDDSAALQLVRYTDENGNEPVTMVGCYSSQWPYSAIMQNAVYSVPAFLYASEPTYCEWGPWVDDENGDTHTRECTDENCGKTQTAAHSFGKWSKLDGTNHIRSCTVCGYIEQDRHTFDEGTVVTEATCFRVGKIVYRCTAEDCDASYEAEISMTNHRWGEAWQDSGNGEAHIIACQNEGCNACRAELHNWVNSDEDADKHVCEMCGAEEAHSWESNVSQAPSCIAPGEGKRTCLICSAEEVFTMPIDPEAHNWGDWKVVTAPGEGAEGLEKCVCSWAPNDHVQTRPIPALEHEHVYSDWEPYDDEYHRQHCMDDTCAAYTEDKHDLAEEVIQAPDYGVPGQKRVYCQTCWYEQFVEMEPLVCEEPIEKPEEENIREIEDPSFLINNSLPSELLQIVAVEVAMPATVQSPANAYDKYVLNSMDGYLVETVYDVSLQDSAGKKQNLGEDEIATVTMKIGTENATKLANKELMLVHIQGVTRTIYVNVAPEMLDAVGEMTVNKEAGTVTFVTDSFSPFVLAALPAELEITASGKTAADGCEVTVSANASFVSNLMIAVYDKDGKMLAVAMDNGCNLSAEKTYTLQFSGTGKTVKVFLLETGTGFAPRRAAAEGTIN